MSDYCIGVDVGGTFTDAVLTDEHSVTRAKSLTTPHDLGEGVLAACTRLAERVDLTLGELLADVRRFGLGTTAVTNALASQSGRKVGLMTTAGFEDLVPMSLGRWESDDGWLVAPRQIVERNCIYGVRERIDSMGEIIQAMSAHEVLIAGEWLVDHEKVQALTVSFLWSFMNPVHEQRAVELLRERWPDIPVNSGSDLLPLRREYERTTFVLLSAYTSGVFRGIDGLAVELERNGLTVPVLLVHSGGGSITVGEAHAAPVLLAESGPAAGVAAAAAVASSIGINDNVTFDMGGTTLDISVVSNASPSRRTRSDVMGVWTALSSVDVDSVGAGGGSIAWVDALGALRVGPRSAGATPGPACYGQGGTDATVTDALLVLGFLDPLRFLGGSMRLDPDRARASCDDLGRQLQSPSAVEVAWGIREVALAGMVTSTRARLAQRGLDPRQHAIVAYGGCGGLFAPSVASQIGAPVILVPELASVLSAFGAATTDIRRERIRSVGGVVTDATDEARRIAATLQGEVERDLEQDAVKPADRDILFEADLRIRRQKWELSIPVSPADLESGDLTQLVTDFKSEYVKRYGTGAFMTGAPIEMVSLRAIGIGRTFKTELTAPPSEPSVEIDMPAAASRTVYVDRGSSGTSLSVLSWQDLNAGNKWVGPSLVDGADTTVWVPPGSAARIDGHRNIVIELQGG